MINNCIQQSTKAMGLPGHDGSVAWGGAWDPNFNSAFLTLSDQNRGVYITGGRTARSDVIASNVTGRYYFETKITAWAAGLAPIVGIMDANALNYDDALAFGIWPGDGTQTKTYHLGVADYGLTFVLNDVIGVLYDSDVGSLSFFKNGVNMGVAFTGIPAGDYRAYAASPGFSYPCGVLANFGTTPFV